MQFTLLQDLFKPTGRTGRVAFCLALAVFITVFMAFAAFVSVFGQSLLGGFVGLVWFCINFYIMYCVFVRRLHDMSLSGGVFFVTLLLTVFVAAFTIYVSGLSDYFDALMANPEIAQDAEANQALIQQYNADIAANKSWTGWVNLVPLLLLTLFCAFKPGSPKANKYGQVLGR